MLPFKQAKVLPDAINITRDIGFSCHAPTICNQNSFQSLKTSAEDICNFFLFSNKL